MRTEVGLNEYRFALSYAHPDRFLFTEEELRFGHDDLPGEARWQPLSAGHTEAMIVEAAQSDAFPGVNSTTASVIVNLLRISVSRHFRQLRLQEEMGL